MQYCLNIFRFFVLLSVKCFAHLFYRFDVSWVAAPIKDWNQAKVLILLNHTSLYEPLFTALFPISQLWRASRQMVVPGADITLNRPIAGRFFKALGPKVISISRKRDQTWTFFLDQIGEDSLIVILPEGRMKRKTGLDKNNRPMSVLGGFTDILEMVDHGQMVILYSGGLHHIQHPGQKIPKIFRTVKAKLELVDLADYHLHFSEFKGKEKKQAMIADLEARLRKHCP